MRNKQKKQTANRAQRGTVTREYLKEIVNEMLDGLIAGRCIVPVGLADNTIILYAADGSTINISQGADAQKGGLS